MAKMQYVGDTPPNAFARGSDYLKIPAGDPIEYRASVVASPVDRGGVVHMISASANTFTIPTDATMEALYGDGPFPNGTALVIVQWGAGQTTIVFATGVTVRNSFAGLAISEQYAQAVIRKVGPNEWHVMAMG